MSRPNRGRSHRQLECRPWRRRQFWLGSAILILAFVLLCRLQVEWLWFEQFSLQAVLVKRWTFQIIAGFLAFTVASLGAFWRSSWLQLSDDHSSVSSDDSHRFALSGWRYGLMLLITAGAVVVALAVLMRLAWLACTNPFSLGHWWEQPMTGHPSISCTLLLLIAVALIARSRRIRTAPLFIFGSLCTCFTAARAWGLWALALNIPATGELEPLFGADVSFGLGRFSAIALLLQLLLAQLVLTVATALLRRFSRPADVSNWSFPGLQPIERQRLRPFLALILALLAALLWLSRHQLLWTQDGVVAGAGWLDVHLVLPLRQIESLSMLALAVLVLPLPWAIHRRQWRAWATTLLFAALLAELLLTPSLDWLVVRPRELKLERPYLTHAIAATRRAFQLDAITTRSLNPASRVRPEDLVEGASTLDNVRLWDSQPLLATNRQLQQLRVYYRFSSAAVDRYQITADPGQRQQVIITARELDQAALPDRSRTWLNRHFVFTHGYGFTLSPVNTRAVDGLPEYFISDLGKATRIQGNESLSITQEDVEKRVPIGRAALYFGMLPSPYAIAPTSVQEFDFPEGDENTYNHYSGNAGVPLSNPWQRLTAAVYLKEPRLLNTGSLKTSSKLLLRRDVRKRVKALAPFLSFEGDPYLVSVPIEGEQSGYDSAQNQYWIVDGYTSSSTYPYAADLPDGTSMRYVRNSVKAVVDAYNGNVHLYVSEPDDPMIGGWMKLFPELFQPLDAMPTQLRDHLMVPSHMFQLQVQQLLRYHVTDPRTFYSGDDVWQVPLELYGQRQIPVAPYHITAQLTPAQRSEFLLLQPLTPLARPNLSAWLAARSDSPHYGELVLIRFPPDLPIFGPEQIQALINQNPVISQQFGLWDRAGSEVVQGNLLVLPLGKALLYVEPVYLRARQGGLPTLTRVVVSDGSRVAMDVNLMDALKALLGKHSATAVVQDLHATQDPPQSALP